MKMTFIDLRPYGYVVEELGNGYIYCPYMPLTHETDEELERCITRLDEEYKEKLKGV